MRQEEDGHKPSNLLLLFPELPLFLASISSFITRFFELEDKAIHIRVNTCHVQIHSFVRHQNRFPFVFTVNVKTLPVNL